MACLYSNAATSLNTYVSLHSKSPLLHSTSVSSSSLSIRRYHSHNSSYANTVIRCSNIQDKQRPEYIRASRISDPKYVRIFDTTLRDGEQAAGAAMTSKEKFEIARQLTKLRVDVIEAGFPASSDADLEFVKLVARELGNIVDEEGYVPVISAFARCTKKDIDRAWDALKYAKKPLIHLFLATSEIHMKHKLKMSREQVVEKARSMVAYARSTGCEDVRFSAEDSGRTDKEFLYHIFGEVIKAGASSVGLPDTVGCNLPSEFAQLVADVKANTPGIENVLIAVHCHNDLGVATASTLAGISAGAREVDVTINGIGERAGNAPLEEVVMAIKCCGEQALDGLHTGINTQHIITTSKMVEEYSGLNVQPNKAIVGANAFVHESGIHQDGILKHRATYEFISPEDVGFHRANVNGIVLGRLSGRHAFKAKMLELGYECDKKELEDLFLRFKTMAERKKKFTDEDLKALASDKLFQPEVPQVAWQLGDVQITRGSLGLYTATVKLIDTNGQEHVACSVGTGPVDAAYKAVNLILKVAVTILEYSIDSVTDIDAIASTKLSIRGEDDYASMDTSNGQIANRTVSGTGADGDIVISSVQAYVGALNKLLSYQKSKGSALV